MPTDDTESLDHQEVSQGITCSWGIQLDVVLQPLAQTTKADSPTEATKEAAEGSKEPMDAIQVSDAKEVSQFLCSHDNHVLTLTTAYDILRRRFPR